MTFSTNNRRSGPWLTGGATIASAIGINRHDIPDLVKNEGFPAFKYRGRWRALPDDIESWSRGIASKHRRKPRRRPPRAGR
jgi:hypothetical protein